MATFSLSPSVEVIETDLSVVVAAVSTSIGGFSGSFRWGPVNEATVIDNENTLKSIFGEPDTDTARDFQTACSFLAYSNNLRVVRVAGENAKNAAAIKTGVIQEQPYVENDLDLESKVSAFRDLTFIAKYPGALGNSIGISIADSATFGNWKYRDIFGSAVNVNKTGATVDQSAELTLNSTSLLEVGMYVSGIGIGDNARVQAIGADNKVTLTVPCTASGADVNITFTKYSGAPENSGEVEKKGGTNDELHIVIYDANGEWTGTKGTVLERYVGVSKASDALDYSGATNYYVDVLNRQSSYLSFAGTHIVDGWGVKASGTDFPSMEQQFDVVLSGGVDANAEADISVAKRIEGYNQYKRSDSIDISLLIVAGLTSTEDQVLLTKHCIQNIAETRKDCIVLCSPPMEAVVGNTNNELQSVLTFRGLIGSSSYAAMDSGWKYMYNRYADNYVWVPLAGDVAGLCAYTDKVADTWYSPAGYNRGFIKNSTKLAYNPGSQAERDSLYVNGINPVTSQINEGTVLFGDKTLQTKASAFDRINVRRLFIVLEKSIATSAKYSLFEFNDAFTRNSFVNMVEPYLRDVQGRRGLTDFKVVCDDTNNTAEVIDKNGFVADIYLKPARSINFIQLNFVAVSTGVEFSEVVLS